MTKQDGTMEIKIEKGVPMPANLSPGSGRKSIYRWADMEPGDSFAVSADGNMKVVRNRLVVSASHWAKYHNLDWKFATRAEGDKARIWRLS